MAVEAATDHGRGSSDKLTSGCSVAASAAVCRAKVNTQIRTLEAKMEARTQHFVFVTGPLSRTATVASDDRFFPFPKQTSSTRFRSSSRPTQTFTAIKFLLVRQKKKQRPTDWMRTQSTAEPTPSRHESTEGCASIRMNRRPL